MIKGLGTDILEIARFKKVLEKHNDRFLKRIFTAEEIEYCKQFKDQAARLAARFSAKEAISKALGCGIGEKLAFKDMSITKTQAGKPLIQLTKEASKRFDHPHIELSMSHCQKYVTATAIWF